MSLRIKVIQFLIHQIENQFFYPKLRRFYRQKTMDRAPVIIDVGANKGQSIDFFLNLYPNATIHAFEPNTALYLRLVDKYTDHVKIFLYNLGVSSESGSLRFYENVLDETSSFERLNKHSTYLKKKSIVLGTDPDSIVHKEYDVCTTSLADFFAKHEITEVDILKIDVEGHEFQCIKGLMIGSQKFTIKYLQLEEHHDDMYTKLISNNEIEKLLAKHGLILDANIKHPFGNFHELIYANKGLLV